MTRQKELGDRGEQIAEEFLLRKGLECVDRNFHAQGGEIDLVMYDKKKDEYIFVEVKTRTNKNFGTGEVSITKTKFEKILKAAEDFFRKKLKTYEIPFFRVDAVIIEIEQGEISCEHLPNIGWEDF